MIHRKLDTGGDYTFGQGAANFHVDNREAVAQAVKTRLGLREGEWFLDINVGTPYNSQILGMGKVPKYDSAIKAVILNTQGVTELTAYSSQLDTSTRKLTISATISTKYGQTQFTQVIL